MSEPRGELEFNGAVVIVTGASQGLGRRTAIDLAKHGASVVCTSRSESSLESVVEAIEDQAGPGAALAVAADVRRWEAVQNLVEETMAVFGPVDVLINNAGVNESWLLDGDHLPVADIPVDVWDQIIETNLCGAFLCSKAVLPSMLDRDEGRLVHISSGMGIAGRANRSAYVASKFGLEGFAQSLAKELDDTGVDSMIAEPGGGVDTQRFSEHLDSDERASRLPPDVLVEPLRLLVAGYGENGGRYTPADFC